MCMMGDVFVIVSEEQDKLFLQLKDIDANVIADGIVDDQAYQNAKYRIVYIMKEANGGKGWSLTEFLKEGGRPQTWNTVARWTEAILNLGTCRELNWTYLEDKNDERRKQYLRCIGVVNLKKTSGTFVSDEQEIFKSALENRDIIKKQIDLYQPNIIICCGTGDAFVKSYFNNISFSWSRTKRGIWYIKKDDKVIISFLHPSARVSANILHYSLIDAVIEILGA